MTDQQPEMMEETEPSPELEAAMAHEQEAEQAAPGPAEPSETEATAEAPSAPEASVDDADEQPETRNPKPDTRDVAPEVLAREVEAVLMSIDRAMPPAKLAEVLRVDGVKPIHEVVKTLNKFYDANDRSFRIEQVAGGYQILTLPAFKELIASLHKTREDNKLSPAAMETLAIIAYRQPIMRSAIEAVRGVACGEVLRVLMDHHLVKIVGRAEELGRPMLYGTTKRFLELFGLAGLKDLPKVEELKRS
jgi:segregation and condensation protein B